MGRRRLVSSLWLVVGLSTAVWLGLACGGGGELFAEGVILEVEATSLTEVASFTLRTNDGETLVFAIAPDAAVDPDNGFVASHLRSHAGLGEQVAVYYREEGDARLAFRLEDR